MRHAIYLPPFGSFGDVHELVDLAVVAEEAGWDGFFLWDWLVDAAAPDDPRPDVRRVIAAGPPRG